MFIRLAVLLAICLVAAIVLRSTWVAAALGGLIVFWSIMIWFARNKRTSRRIK
jgi:hypothetical protein